MCINDCESPPTIPPVESATPYDVTLSKVIGPLAFHRLAVADEVISLLADHFGTTDIDVETDLVHEYPSRNPATMQLKGTVTVRGENPVSESWDACLALIDDRLRMLRFRVTRGNCEVELPDTFI